MNKLSFRRKIFIGIILFIIISNIKPIQSLYTLVFDENTYQYSNGNGTFTKADNQFKNNYYNLSKTVHRSYIDSFPNSKDTIVYRTFKKNPLHFYKWLEYFTDKRYELPYKSWASIKKQRPKDLTPYQKFIQFY